MPRLTKIYTRTGDNGTTAIVGNARIAKTDPRIDAIGLVDETNCLLGEALAFLDSLPEGAHARLHADLTPIQSRLFDVGADLATPLSDDPRQPARTNSTWTKALEDLIDAYNKKLPALTSFIMPGGSKAASVLHHARAVARNAERAIWHAIDIAGQDTGGVNPETARYLNRLSDLLFVLARYANQQGQHPETLWVPAPHEE